MTKMILNSGASNRNYQANIVLDDEILAIGKPDSKLLDKIGLKDAIALIGKQNTYLLTLGGEELEQISKLKLDSRRIKINSYKTLFIREHEFWGSVQIEYDPENAENTSSDVIDALKIGGFNKVKKFNIKATPSEQVKYINTVNIEGKIFPAINIPEDKMAALHIHRRISFYPPPDDDSISLHRIKKKIKDNPGNIFVLAYGAYTDAILGPIFLGFDAYQLSNNEKQVKSK